MNSTTSLPEKSAIGANWEPGMRKFFPSRGRRGLEPRRCSPCDEGYAPSVRYLPTNEASVAEVAARTGAIGYTGLGALRGGGDRVKPVPLAADSQSAPVSATPEAIKSKDYPLSRALFLVTAGPPPGTSKAFIDFCLSASGQALFQRAGYIATKPLAR